MSDSELYNIKLMLTSKSEAVDIIKTLDKKYLKIVNEWYWSESKEEYIYKHYTLQTFLLENGLTKPGYEKHN